MRRNKKEKIAYRKVVKVSGIDNELARKECEEINSEMSKMKCKCEDSFLDKKKPHFGVSPLNELKSSSISFICSSWCCDKFKKELYAECIEQFKKRFPNTEIKDNTYEFDPSK